MRSRRFNPDRDVAEWTGPTIRYDLLREVTICFLVVVVLVVGLAVLFSSPDDPSITLKSWSVADPTDFVQTSIAELDGTSGTAGYGPPYTNTANASQVLYGVSIESFVGRRIPIDTERDFILSPLRTIPDSPVLHAALVRYEAAPISQQQSWDAAFGSLVTTATYTATVKDNRLVLPKGDYGPVGTMMSSLLSMARAGALDGALTSTPQLYGTNYTKPLLFLADGSYLGTVAQERNLTGDQWGMMNETGNYPGQAWLWLYTFWYQVPPMNSSTNGDIEVWAIMMALTVGPALVPIIPGVRSIPRWSRLYRVIWRQHYRAMAR
jgi:hypothetical protein